MSSKNLKDKLKEFALYAKEKRKYCEGNEQQTKQSLVNPYMEEILNINPRDPEIVRLEFSTGKKTGIKDGIEKVDYAIFEPGDLETPLWIIEAKAVDSTLDNLLIPKLRGYLINTRAQYAVLTNGIQWHWYWYNLYSQNHGGIKESLFFKNDVCRPLDRDLDWLSAVCKLNKSSAPIEAAKQEFLSKLHCWFQKMAEDPSQSLQNLVKRECEMPNVKLIKEQLPVMLSKAFQNFTFMQGESEIKGFQASAVPNVSETEHEKDFPSLATQREMSSRANRSTTGDGWSELPETEGATRSKLCCRYSLNGGEDWIEVSNATDLMLKILKWCAQNNKNGKDHYYQMLNKNGFVRINAPILVHKDAVLDLKNERDHKKISLTFDKRYSHKNVDGWRIFKDLSNCDKKPLIEQLLERCIREDGTSPVLGKDLWVEIPNAHHKSG